MKKSLFVLVVLAILSMAIPANAQGVRYGYIPTSPEGWYYMVQGDQVGMLTADNLAMVRQYSNQLPRSLSGDLRWNGVAAAYGIQTASGFLPMYDRNKQPLSGRQRIERGAGIVLAVDGVRRIINNPRGAAGWIEAAVGAVLVNDSRYRGQPKNQRDNGTVVVPPQDQQGVRVGPDGIPVMVGNRPNGGYQPVAGSVQPGPRWTIRNGTGGKGELLDGDQFIKVLEPGETYSASNPQTGYRLMILVPTDQGTIETREAAKQPRRDGWDFICPDCK